MTGNADFPPVFMFGFERSGTTMLSMMMGAHPQLAVPLSTTGMWYRYQEHLAQYQPLSDPRNACRLARSLLAEERIGLWDVELQLEDVLSGFTATQWPDFLARFHALYAAKKGKPYWASMDISTLTHMDTANQWFPDARFVHIVRDGRDVALSHETYAYGTSNTQDCAEQWVAEVRTNLKMGAMLNKDRYLVIRYEDLVEDSQRVLEEVCEFIGLAYAPEMLAYHRMVDEKIPQSKRFLWPALDTPPDRSKAHGWKLRMSTTKRALFERAAGSLLRDLGYETYANPPKTIASYAYELWCAANRGERVQRALRALRPNR